MKYSIAGGEYRSSDDAVEHSPLGQMSVMYQSAWGLTAFGGARMSVALWYQRLWGWDGQWADWGRCRLTAFIPAVSRRDGIGDRRDLAYTLQQQVL
ncbi:hypothetical protein ACLB1M_23610 [Escherichia coli]